MFLVESCRLQVEGFQESALVTYNHASAANN